MGFKAEESRIKQDDVPGISPKSKNFTLSRIGFFIVIAFFLVLFNLASNAFCTSTAVRLVAKTEERQCNPNVSCWHYTLKCSFNFLMYEHQLANTLSTHAVMQHLGHQSSQRTINAI